MMPALSRPHVERALAALPGVELINGYGPTENTTFSTTSRLRRDLARQEAGRGGAAAGGQDPWAMPVPIGRPIGASRAYVLIKGRVALEDTTARLASRADLNDLYFALATS